MNDFPTVCLKMHPTKPYAVRVIRLTFLEVFGTVQFEFEFEFIALDVAETSRQHVCYSSRPTIN